MKCPACGNPLVVVERESIEVDWCAHCRGIWFDAGELEILAQKAGRRLEPGMIGAVAKTGERRRRCPRCRRRMEKATPAGEPSLLIDRCVEHGLWFDAGELGALLRGLDERDGASATVVGFLDETFSPRPASGGLHSLTESNP